MIPGAAFYILAWVFAVPQPDRKPHEGTITFANHLSKLECNSKAVELAEQKLTKRKPLYSRFVCVPVKMESNR